MTDVVWARNLACELLAGELPRRWRHVQGVAGRAAGSGVADGERLRLLVAAAWLHDIGYASTLIDTGLHPIDGARFLRRANADERVVGLVAHHSCAHVEARLRGLEHVLDREFPRDDSLPHDELCFCDMTTSPDGDLVDVATRLTEIRARYGAGHVVTQFIDLVEEPVTRTVRQVEARLARQPR